MNLKLTLLLCAVLLFMAQEVASRGAEKPATPPQVANLLMFEGRAEEAMKFYVDLVPGSKIEKIERYGSGQAGKEGSIYRAAFSLGGRNYECIDSPAHHPFTFTPAISMTLTCRTEKEVDDLVAKLSKDGQVLMPLGEYPFAKKFAWVTDRFGVSWQVSMP